MSFADLQTARHRPKGKQASKHLQSENVSKDGQFKLVRFATGND